MQTALNKQEIEILKQRIESAAPEAREALQAQLDDLLKMLDKKSASPASESDVDADVEALFDNMPV